MGTWGAGADERHLDAVVSRVASDAARRGTTLTTREVSAIVFLADRGASEVLGRTVTGDRWRAGPAGPEGEALSRVLAPGRVADAPWRLRREGGRELVAVCRHPGRTGRPLPGLAPEDADELSFATLGAVDRRVGDVVLAARRDPAYLAARRSRAAGDANPAIDVGGDAAAGNPKAVDDGDDVAAPGAGLSEAA